MGLLDRLFGRREEPRRPMPNPYAGGRSRAGEPMSDEQALERYRYLIRTAPPETIEQVHAEAFEKLTPTQRQQVLRELAAVTPERERAALGNSDDPRALARLATRAEMRRPGAVEQAMGRAGPGFGGMMAGSLLTSFLAGFAGSMIANQVFDMMQGSDFGGEGFGGAGESAPVADQGDFGGGDFGGGDFGGDFGGGDI